MPGDGVNVAPLPGHKILIDSPAKEPALGYKEYGRALADIINQSVPQFAVGIFGGWGSGKTTLMQEVRKGIDPKDAICVEFSAWRYEKEDHLIVPLLATIKDAIEEWASGQDDDLGKVALQVARTVGSVVTSLVAGLSLRFGIPKALELSFDADKALDRAAKVAAHKGQPAEQQLTSVYHACFKALRLEFGRFLGRESQRRIVVFVDDLDRCLPKGVLQVLESMKLFFDLHGFVFVVGLDQQVVEWCIDVAYSRYRVQKEGERGYQVRGSDYIKKIFQVPFTLFPVSVVQIDEFLETLVRENGVCQSQADEIRTLVRPHLSYVVGNAGMNPREVKRFINAYTLNMKVKPNLHRQAVLALRAITFRPDWQLVQEALYVYGEVFLETLSRQVRGEAAALSTLHRDLAKIPDSFIQYVSDGAPGNALLHARPLDEYIRSGAATGSGSSHDPRIFDLIRRVGGLRSALDSAASPGEFGQVESLVSMVAKDAESLVLQGRSELANPFVEAVRRSIEALRAELEKGRDAFEKPEKQSQWKLDFDARIPSVTSAPVQLYQAGER